MNATNITWRGEPADDVAILRELPPDLAKHLGEVNGFILYNGALHVRGASVSPEWHSLRAAQEGPNAFHRLYECVRATDIVFAQDQLGDQFLLRDNQVWRLMSETGDVQCLSESLDHFFEQVDEDIEAFLNVELGRTTKPGQLLLAYPPFVMRTTDGRIVLKPGPATDVIRFHADLAEQIRNVQDGRSIKLKIDLDQR
jgi:hypothetical protein